MENQEIIEIFSSEITATQPAETNPYISLATSQNTRKAYRSDIRHYESWGGRLPATVDMIAAYLQFFADKLNPRTLSRRLVALKNWHVYQNFNDPTLHPALHKMMIGISKTHGKPKEKARPLSLQELIQIHHYLENENTLASIRDNALLQIGYFGALRRSEIVAIQFEHLRFEKEGVEILIPFSKTDSTQEGQFSSIPYGNKTICAIRALKTWLDIIKINSGTIFRRITLGEHLGINPLTPLSVNNILKKRAHDAGIENPNLFSAHSLRRGLATSAAKSGANLQAIMRAGRWKQTSTAIEYIEANDRFKDNAAFNVLQTLAKIENE